NMPRCRPVSTEGPARDGAIDHTQRMYRYEVRDRSPSDPDRIPGARQQPRLAREELIAGLDDRHGRADVRRQRHLVQQLPDFRDLRDHRRALRPARDAPHARAPPGRPPNGPGPVSARVVLESLPYLLPRPVVT